MCWSCDHPEADQVDYLDHIRDTIREHRWAIQGVEQGRLHPPWAYTVGLSPYSKPELVVTGLPLTAAAKLLNMSATHLMHAEAPVPGEQIQFDGGPFVEIVELTEPSAHLHTAVDLYGRDVRALQLVHADDRGHWPWDVGYRNGQGGQPVLGRRHR